MTDHGGNICPVVQIWIGHDSGRIRVNENDLIPFFLQGLACLSSRVIKLTGLAYDNGSGTQDHNFLQIHALPTYGYMFLPLLIDGDILRLHC